MAKQLQEKALDPTALCSTLCSKKKTCLGLGLHGLGPCGGVSDGVVLGSILPNSTNYGPGSMSLALYSSEVLANFFHFIYIFRVFFVIQPGYIGKLSGHVQEATWQ